MRPGATWRTLSGSVTRVGEVRCTTSARPSCPSELAPQHQSPPAGSTAQVLSERPPSDTAPMARHAPIEHVVTTQPIAAHAVHAPPPTPQAMSLSPARQVAPSQHPVQHAPPWQLPPGQLAVSSGALLQVPAVQL